MTRPITPPARLRSVFAAVAGSLSLIVSSCAPPVDNEEPPPLGDAPPMAPERNDDAFEVNGLEAWYLIGNDLTEGEDALALSVLAPADVTVVDAWIDGEGHRLSSGEGTFELALDISDVAPGEIEVLLVADGGDTAFARHTFTRSHPLYVLVGTDWDDPDNAPLTYAHQEELHEQFDELRITHFLGPYTYTDPATPDERRQYVTGWLKDLEMQHADEIAVHIHPYCNFVETTEVPCRTQPSVVYDEGDTSGYTVESAAYTEEEYTTLLLATDALFEAQGFSKPTAFRAGAWTADASTLAALVNAGYTVDSDAYNWARMEEWIGVGNGGFYAWVSEHWAAIGDESQPYRPSVADPQLAGEPAFDLLEVPLNGVMADYVTGEEMIEIFALNWPGGALSAPAHFAIGYHPGSYYDEFHYRMRVALEHIDLARASFDAGPVVYATFSELTQVWP
jgi:hypothetical protein